MIDTFFGVAIALIIFSLFCVYKSLSHIISALQMHNARLKIIEDEHEPKV